MTLDGNCDHTAGLPDEVASALFRPLGSQRCHPLRQDYLPVDGILADHFGKSFRREGDGYIRRGDRSDPQDHILPELEASGLEECQSC